MDILLCTCNRAVALDRGGVVRRVGDGGMRVHVYQALCRSAPEPAGLSPEGVFIGCRRATGPLRAAMEQAGTPSHRIVAWDLADALRGVPEERAATVAAAAARAARALAEGARPPPAWTVAVGPRVVVAGPGSRPVAEALAGHLDVLWVAPEVPAGGAGFRAYPGRIAGVEGALGDFRVTVEGPSPVDPWLCVGCMACRKACPPGALDAALRIDPDRCDGCGRCEAACAAVGALELGRTRVEVAADQVLWIGGGRPPRPGLHTPQDPEQAWSAAAEITAVSASGEVEAWAAVGPGGGPCAAGRAGLPGCALCRDACPTAAVAVSRPGPPDLDHGRCSGCGACAGTCPTGALEPLPWGRADLGRAAGALGRARVGLAFVCEHARPPEPGWGGVPVTLPHLGGLSWMHLAAPLAAGSPWIGVFACAMCGEPLGEAVRLAEKVLARAGLEGRIARGAIPSLSMPAQPWGDDLPWGDSLACRAALLLPLVREHPEGGELAGPFGRVEAARPGCTGCGACAEVCPTGALQGETDRPVVYVTEIRCTGCGLCAAACPERVLRVAPGLRWGAAAFERRELVRAHAHACPRCGRVFATREALAAVQARLGDRFPNVPPHLLELCPDCRAVEALRDA